LFPGNSNKKHIPYPKPTQVDV